LLHASQHEQGLNISYSYLVIIPLESIIQDQITEATSTGIAAMNSKHAQLLFATAEYVKQPWFRSLLKDKKALCCLK
jgi:hypothetical protein